MHDTQGGKRVGFIVHTVLKASGMPTMSSQMMVGAGPTQLPDASTTGVPSTVISLASTGPPDTLFATVEMVA